MANLEFFEIAALLGSCRLASIDKTPVDAATGEWELYKGSYKVHTNEFPFEVLYLRSRATKQGMLAARKKVFKTWRNASRIRAKSR